MVAETRSELSDSNTATQRTNQFENLHQSINHRAACLSNQKFTLARSPSRSFKLIFYPFRAAYFSPRGEQYFCRKMHKFFRNNLWMPFEECFFLQNISHFFISQKNNWKILILCKNEAPQRREASSLSQGDEDDRNKEKLGNKAGSEGLPGEAYSYLKWWLRKERWCWCCCCFGCGCCRHLLLLRR